MKTKIVRERLDSYVKKIGEGMLDLKWKRNRTTIAYLKDDV